MEVLTSLSIAPLKMLFTILTTPTQSVKPEFSNFVGIAEFSILACLAIFLIKGIWQEHINNEKQERELTDKLINHLLEQNDERK